MLSDGRAGDPFQVLFRLALREGHLVAVAVPPASWDDAALPAPGLHADERAFLATLPAARRPTWAAGRTALRLALADLGLGCGPVLATDRGAPALPDHVLGSISHKHDVAVALVTEAPSSGLARVGVDVERPRPPAADISRRVLTDSERAEVAAVPDARRWPEVFARFSAKEALYKALDPFVRRYVGFQEVEVARAEGEALRFQLRLTGGEGPFRISGSVREGLPWTVTTALVESYR